MGIGDGLNCVIYEKIIAQFRSSPFGPGFQSLASIPIITMIKRGQLDLVLNWLQTDKGAV